MLHHRLGLALGPAVLLWFLSGVVLLWVPYPRLTEREWFMGAEAIPLHDCCAALGRLSQTLDRPEGIESVRIRMVGSRMVATAQLLNGTMVAFAADTAEPIAPLAQEWAQRVARQYSPGTSVEEMNVIDHDVWTVHQQFDPHRPLWKVQLSGEPRLILYISSVTGDIVQDTTEEERRWSLVGAVIHWWYWPWLRRHWFWWDQVVWWVSAIGTVAVVAGALILGRERMKHGWSGFLPGRWKLHRVLGVVAGVPACCWMVSGWLSMDHGRWFSDGKVMAQERERFMGGRLVANDIEAIPDLSVMAMKGAVKEIRLIKMAGIVHFITRESSSRQHILAVTQTKDVPQDEFQDGVVKAAARSFLGDGVLTITRPGEIDSSTCSSVGDEPASPLTRVATTHGEPREVLVDTRIGTVVERLDASRQLYHWLFNGLHRWELPWRSQYCDVRRMLMTLWCLLGAGLAGSGLWAGLFRSRVKVLPNEQGY